MLKTFVCRSISQVTDQPGYQSEKTYDFSALYISVRNRRIDEFWDAGSRAFVTTTGISRSTGHRTFLNRWLSDMSHASMSF